MLPNDDQDSNEAQSTARTDSVSDLITVVGTRYGSLLGALKGVAQEEGVLALWTGVRCSSFFVWTTVTNLPNLSVLI